MGHALPVTREFFMKRLVDLCLRSGLSGFPKDDVNQHILFKSAVLTLGKSDTYTEKEVNEKLKHWINDISQIKNIDHITLRRWLVDTGYLNRNNDGSCYQISQSGPRPQFFDDAIDQINVMEVINTGREEIARRKKEYMERARMQSKDR